MSGFDYLRCEMPLPEADSYPGDGMFRTDDLGDEGRVFVIYPDGRIEVEGWDEYNSSPVVMPIEGCIEFYDGEYRWCAFLSQGKCTELRKMA